MVSDNRGHQRPSRLTEKDRLARRFRLLSALVVNGGNFNGGINLVRDEETGQSSIQKKLAVKDIKKDFRAVVEEIRIMKMLHQRNIVKLIEGFVTQNPPDGSIYMEWGDMGSLVNIIEAYIQHKSIIPEEYVLNVFQQLSAAVAYLHTGHDIHDDYKRYDGESITSWVPIVHNDIKPANIFLTSGQRNRFYPERYPRLLLGDFGLAALQPHGDRGTDYGGTPCFMAPERRKTPASDVWGMGATMEAVCRKALGGLLGRRPKDVDPEEFYSNPKYKVPRGPGDNYSSVMKTIMAGCEERLPENRMTAWKVARCCRRRLLDKGGPKYWAPLPDWALPFPSIEHMKLNHSD